MVKLGYEKALKEVFKIRKARQLLYNDLWKQNQDWELLAMIKQKVGRLETNIIRNKNNIYENIEDTLIDLINYSLFLLENKLNGRKQDDKY